MKQVTYKKTISLIFIGVIVIGGIVFSRFVENRNGGKKVDISQVAISDTAEQTVAPTDRRVTVYRSTTCGCCLGYITELEKQGFIVDVKSLREQDMTPIKKQYSIPEDKQSCHTTVIGDYFIEGHVPMVAVEKLLAEKPQIDGIGLPGMPLGTPGMPGIKGAPYEIYEKIGSVFSEFMIL